MPVQNISADTPRLVHGTGTIDTVIRKLWEAMGDNSQE